MAVLNMKKPKIRFTTRMTMVLLLDVGAGKVDCAAATAMSPPLGDRAAAALLILLRLKTWDRRGRPASVQLGEEERSTRRVQRPRNVIDGD